MCKMLLSTHQKKSQIYLINECLCCLIFISVCKVCLGLLKEMDDLNDKETICLPKSAPSPGKLLLISSYNHWPSLLIPELFHSAMKFTNTSVCLQKAACYTTKNNIDGILDHSTWNLASILFYFNPLIILSHQCSPSQHLVFLMVR